MNMNVFVLVVTFVCFMLLSGCASTVSARTPFAEGSISPVESEAIGAYCQADAPMQRTLMKLYDRNTGELVTTSSVITCVPEDGEYILLIACNERAECVLQDSSISIKDFLDEHEIEIEEEQAI